MRMTKTLGIGLVALLLMSMATVVSSTTWDGVPDDPTPSQAIWVDPKNTICFDVDDTFVVDVLINLTDPLGAGTGLWGFEYKLKWNLTMLEAKSIQYHSPWSIPPAFLIINGTGSGPPEAPEGFDYHWLAITAIAPNVAFTGVRSLCTYIFQIVGNGNASLDIYDNKLVDDTATLIAHTTVDGYVATVDACVIRADGSVFPSRAPISNVDNVTYTMRRNIGKPIVVERDNIVLDGAGYTLQGTGIGIDLSGRSNVTIRNMQIEEFGYGIYLNHSASNSILGNTVTANSFEGIRLYESSNNNITGNNIVSNELDGIVLYGSSNNTIAKNNLIGNYDGIRLYESSNNSIGRNNIVDNYYGISLAISSNNSIYETNITDNYYGIKLFDSSNNSICGNDITNNEYGITIAEISNHNRIRGNEITRNTYGVSLESSYNNKIYHNNFIANTLKQVYSSASTDTWDDGYPSGGNYWSDHNPPDMYSGPYQNETGRDKIGDISYIIDGNNTDRYPLIYPYGYVPGPDLDGGGIINIVHIVLCALAFGSKPGDSKWNPYVDLNQDGVINIIDLVMVAVHLGETW